MEEVVKRYLHGNKDPEFEVEVLDISAVDQECDSYSEPEEEAEQNSVQEMLIQSTMRLKMFQSGDFLHTFKS